MSKRQSLMVIGAWVLILPFLGFPSDWKTALWLLTGLVIIGAAYRLKPEGDSGAKDPAAGSGRSASYVEHRSTAVPSPSAPVAPPVINPDKASTP